MRSGALLVGFWVCAAVHLALVAAQAAPFDTLTKAMLMPLLAAWAAASGGSRGLVAALLFSWGGDVCLNIDGLFIPGMALFAAAHVCYLSCFARRGALRRLPPAIPAGYGLAWLAAIVVLWPGLGDLRAPVAAYSLLLVSTAVIAWGVNRRAGAGALLFLLSDSLIGVSLAGLPLLPLHDVVVMATYLAAQYLLASGLMSTPEHPGAARPLPTRAEDRGPEPADTRD
ncbi:putative membrane protein YhhN [Nonomuraea thailandensis]|uniref:Membrane protein YhhN n=1 Tax=Nonomuraea thailandensis TaxID=1188745 RepID=A0A9X2K201_9ACTN|nr:lysoplasmalogenase [Nonomuraea thailandensis]MCP2356530.1 putative membrane protein YhhN [Nonomuraea thailandensis]